MSEAFELSDETPGLFVGVEAREVVAAGVVVQLAVVSMCQQATMIECLTAIAYPAFRSRGRASRAAGADRARSRR